MTIGPAYGDGFVGVANTTDPGTVYVRGSEFVPESVRFQMDELSDVAEVQRRSNGVWNPGELQLAQGSLLLGRDVSLSAAGHHLIVRVPDEHQSLILEASFDDAGSEPPTVPILDELLVRRIQQPDDSGPSTLAVHTASIVSLNLVLTTRLYLQTGATAASDDVALVLSSGIPPNDNVFFKQNFTASKFPANSEIEIDLSPGVEFDPGIQINSNISSPNAFTLLFDATLTVPWFALDFQQQGHEDILTETLVLGNDLSIAFSNDLELVRPNKDLVLI